MATITYEAAMATLQSMFKETDSGVIAMILQSNGGHMEKTVENLLSMQEDMAANAAHDAQQPAQQPSQPQVENHPHPPMPGAPQRSVSTISRSLDISKPLPDDFLRPPSYFRKTKRSQAQVDQDAYLAQLLQDQEFMADLRRHAQRQGRGRRQPQQQQLPRQYPGNVPHGQPAAAPAAGPAAAPAAASAAPASAEDAEHDHDHPAPEEDAPNFKQRLGKLGDAAKRRLAALAARFSNPRGAAAKPQDSQSYMSLPSMDEEDNKNRPQFTIDDDQTEMVELEDRRFRNKDKAAKPNDDLDDM